MHTPVSQTDFSGLNLIKRGKVRDIYDLGEHLLMVASDRISAFDVVMPDPIPDKGIILTQISLFWFEVMKPIVENHVVTADVEQYPDSCRPHAQILQGRSMLVKKTDPLPIECVVRGYISGSGWKAYQQSGSVCGIQLPSGLQESDKLPHPIFTPSTKEEVGSHDINIDYAETVKRIGEDHTARIKDLGLAIYKKGTELAAEKGIKAGDKVVVSNARGEVNAVAVVTKRLQPLQVGGKTVHQIGVLNHWGYSGLSKGDSGNILTPHVGDANTTIPEYKTFLCDVRRV